MTQQTTAIGGAAPLKNDPVVLGRKAWARLKDNARKSWDDWLLIGEALRVGKQECEKKAGKASGSRYNKEFHQWIEANGFGDIDKSDRAKLLLIMENLAEVEAWRATLKDGQRAQWNHPSSVWRAWTCKNCGNRGKAQADEYEDGRQADDEATDEGEDEEAEKKWQRLIQLRAEKSIGHATLNGDWLLPPPEPGTIKAVREAAAAWTKLAEFLEEEVKKAIKQKTPKQQNEAPRAEAA